MSEAGAAVRARRDGLGWTCYALHLAVVTFVILGWLSPWRGLLLAYLIVLPAMMLQWRLNKSACILNNVESKIRTGRWRSPANREEGAFLLRLIESWGFRPSHGSVNLVIYIYMIGSWLVGIGRFRGWV